MTRGMMLGGALREGLRRLTRQPAPPMEMHVATVAAALPLPTTHKSADRLRDEPGVIDSRMTYFGFLIGFIGIPLAILAILTGGTGGGDIDCRRA